MYGWRLRIGLIVPLSNTTMKSEFHRMRPEGVSIHTARMKLTEVSPEALRKMAEGALRAAELLSTAEVDVIIYGCKCEKTAAKKPEGLAPAFSNPSSRISACPPLRQREAVGPSWSAGPAAR